MKRTNLIFSMLLLASLLSCKKEVITTSGGYSYKTSGLVDVTSVLSNGSTHVERVTLPDKIGQLEVVNMHSGDNLLLLFNEMNGSAWQVKSMVSNGELQFPAYDYPLTLKVLDFRFDTIPLLIMDTVICDSVYQHETFDCVVSGKGYTYDDAIVFMLDYKGQSRTSNKEIEGTGIQTIAKRN
ncbi:MAG: hypothetical protein ACI358_00665 [Candidatus Limimorpha sp.]